MKAFLKDEILKAPRQAKEYTILCQNDGWVTLTHENETKRVRREELIFDFSRQAKSVKNRSVYLKE